MLAERAIPIEMVGFWPCPLWVCHEAQNDTGRSPSLLDQMYRRAYANGLSLYAVSYVNFSHQDSDIDEALHRFERVVDEMAPDHASAVTQSA